MAGYFLLKKESWTDEGFFGIGHCDRGFRKRTRTYMNKFLQALRDFGKNRSGPFASGPWVLYGQKKLH